MSYWILSGLGSYFLTGVAQETSAGDKQGARRRVAKGWTPARDISSQHYGSGLGEDVIFSKVFHLQSAQVRGNMQVGRKLRLKSFVGIAFLLAAASVWAVATPGSGCEGLSPQQERLIDATVRDALKK